MAYLITYKISRDGFDVTTGSAVSAAGDVFNNTGKEFILIRNYSGVSTTVTITFPNLVDGQPISPHTYTVFGSGVGGTYMVFGPFPTALYNNANGTVLVTCSPTTNVTIRALQLTPVS